MGLQSGLLGVGGGGVSVPMLVYSFESQGNHPEVIESLALETSLVSIMFTSISSL